MTYGWCDGKSRIAYFSVINFAHNRNGVMNCLRAHQEMEVGKVGDFGATLWLKVIGLGYWPKKK